MAEHYLLIDTETTGLDPNRHACLEVGATILDEKLDPSTAPETVFHHYIRPSPTAIVDRQALEINGHTWAADSAAEGYQRAVEPHVAWKNLYDWLARQCAAGGEPRNVIAVGWNVGFDVGFLKRLWCEYLIDLAPRLGVPNWQALRDRPLKGHGWPMHYHILDLIGVCRYLDIRAGRTRKGYKLGLIAKDVLSDETRAGISTKLGAEHTALADAFTALHVVRALEA
jgi:DNA polymerase III epsilon subunit-like protein